MYWVSFVFIYIYIYIRGTRGPFHRYGLFLNQNEISLDIGPVYIMPTASGKLAAAHYSSISIMHARVDVQVWMAGKPLQLRSEQVRLDEISD